MVQFERLGVVLQHKSPTHKTIAKYNAGMTLQDGIVHMAFRYGEMRKEHDETMSQYAKDEIRYARLTPEGKLVYESPVALIAPTFDYECSGCQDARIIAFEGWYYLTYCGWDKDIAPVGQDRPSMAFARTKDFKTVEKLGIVRHFDWDKDHFLFPERINGKVALVHRVAPNIQLDFFDSIEDMMDQSFWDAYTPEKADASTIMRAANPWENGKVGGSTPPVKTSKGWLFTYHGVQPLTGDPERPFIYRMGLALLDLDDPTKVIARLPYPVLEPEEDYERNGDVNNVVFPVGGYVHNGYFYISYGGADRVTAIARAKLEEILEELEKYRV
jgi:beta-1,2-mannobiose phosphorylase / 1,2-beta-oligomannan phosphorylase